MSNDNSRKFLFGKYKGKYINDIIVSDTQYITWIMKNVSWFWFKHDEVELYKIQLKKGIKPKNQYEIVMETIRKENDINRNKG